MDHLSLKSVLEVGVQKAASAGRQAVSIWDCQVFEAWVPDERGGNNWRPSEVLNYHFLLPQLICKIVATQIQPI